MHTFARKLRKIFLTATIAVVFTCVSSFESRTNELTLNALVFLRSTYWLNSHSACWSSSDSESDESVGMDCTTIILLFRPKAKVREPLPIFLKNVCSSCANPRSRCEEPGWLNISWSSKLIDELNDPAAVSVCP